LPPARACRELQSFALIVSGNNQRASLREFLRESEVRDLKAGRSQCSFETQSAKIICDYGKSRLTGAGDGVDVVA
jgi:hypothetical protein